MKIDSISLGKRIRSIRTKLNITLQSLADQVGVSLVFLSQVERGQNTGSLETIVAIANALQVSIEELLVDSLVVTNSKTDDELSYLLLDCSEKESRVIIKNAENLKSLMKKYLQK